MRRALPPGPPYPTTLAALGWAVRPMPFMERCHARYGDMFTLRMPAEEGTWVFVAHPDLARDVLTLDPAVAHAGEANAVLRPVLGSESVLLLDEAPHMSARKLLLPPFHGERMQRYGELMGEVAERELRTWPAGAPLALHPRMQAVTLEIIMRAVIGVSEPARLARLRSCLEGMLARITTPAMLAFVLLLGPSRLRHVPAFTRAMAAVDGVLAEEIAARRNDPGLAEREDVLSLLVQARHEDGSPMSEAELVAECKTLLVAGHETTATSLSWAVERLVRHPAALERLRDEVLAGEDAYLDAVVKETLRLRPVLPIVLRRLTAPARIGDVELPAGVGVAPCIHLIHRRPDLYPDPRAFRPERFIERPATTYGWMPFGGGVRRCLGASFALFEMKAVLAALVRSLDLRPADAPSERVRRRTITLVPEHGTRVVASPRVRERVAA